MSVSTVQGSENETTSVVQTTAGHAAPIGFFAIGVVINLVLIAAYLIWALKQWKQSGPRDGH
jgi:hypothetical protein